MKTRILFAASEAVPFIKTGGLADVAGALPKSIDRRSFDVRVILPFYSCIDRSMREKAVRLLDFTFPYAGRTCYAGILTASIDDITFYFVDNEDYFKKEKPYLGGEIDVERFLFFDEAVLRALPRIGFRPDVIHCNDWQTGYIPVYIKENSRLVNTPEDAAFYNGIRTVITIHNLKFQGIGSLDLFKRLTGLPGELFVYDKLEAYGCGNMLKAGITYADRITTVSSTYAGEIRTQGYGEGLDGLLNYRSSVLSGIVNGIDTALYDPSSDENIAACYHAGSFTKGKRVNKSAIQKELGLDVDESAFLICIVSRLTGQKGIDLIGSVLDDMLAEDIQLAVLGSGEAWYEEMFLARAAASGGKIAVNTGYYESLAHRIYAGADAILMPSAFEPCGLSQLIALRYGTLPIVRETGGLKDTVEPFNEYEDSGTGFSFRNYDAGELLETVRYARRIFHTDKPAWERMVKRAMKKDYSWKASADRYETLYRGML